jgi:hypothetical protein
MVAFAFTGPTTEKTGPSRASGFIDKSGNPIEGSKASRSSRLSEGAIAALTDGARSKL